MYVKLFIFYWGVAGFFTVALPTDSDRRIGWFEIIACMLLGGFIMPARLLLKLLG